MAPPVAGIGLAGYLLTLPWLFRWVLQKEKARAVPLGEIEFTDST
jgi:hypothetical protein